MTKIVWDRVGDRFFETGINHGVLYPMDDAGNYQKGVAWNGLKAITEKTSGVNVSSFYVDGIKYFNLLSREEFSGTIEANTYPEEFTACDGSDESITGLIIGQQSRKSFGLVYRTLVGNDINGQDYGYKLHLLYGAKAMPSDRGYQSINDSSDIITFSWDIVTLPIEVINFKPISTLIIESNKIRQDNLSVLENILYGVDTPVSIDPRLPLPSEVISLLTFDPIQALFSEPNWFRVGYSSIGGQGAIS